MRSIVGRSKREERDLETVVVVEFLIVLENGDDERASETPQLKFYESSVFAADADG